MTIGISGADENIRDFLRDNLVGEDYGLNDDMQIIATGEPHPLEFPFVVCGLGNIQREFSSTHAIKNEMNFSIVLFDRWTNSRELYIRNCNLCDKIIEILESDFKINNSFKNTFVESVEMESIEVETGQQDTMDIGVIEISFRTDRTISQMK